MLDSAMAVATPEGCQLTLRLAGPVSRARAWILDGLIQLGVLVVSEQALAIAGKYAGPAMVLFTFLLVWFYPVLFEVYRKGQTPGKAVCNLLVLQDDGRPVGWGSSAIRNTLRFIDFLPALFGAGLITMLIDRKFRRLGDLAAGTVVVYRDALSSFPVVPQDATAVPPEVPLAIEEQRAVIEFVRRASSLTEDRAEELADLVAPILASHADGAREALMRTGYYLLGRR